MTTCRCQPDAYPFHCERHACHKTRHWHHLCQTSPGYFRLWEEGRGPGQTRKADRTTILHLTHAKDWQNVILRAGSALGEAGIDANLVELVKPNVDAVRQAIRQHRPRMIVSHAFVVRAVDLIALADQHPRIAFASVCHANQNHVLTWPQFLRDERLLLEATKSRPNFFFGTPDPYTPWPDLGYQRFFHWPNPVYLPPWEEPQKLDPPVVGIICRADWMKAIPAQIAAARLVQQSHGARVVMQFSQTTANAKAIREHAAVCGLEYEMLPWTPLEGWYGRLRREISLVLQATFADSFNYVSLDAASCGRPFVGSYAIRHTPRAWHVADPNNSHEIAAVARRILDRYEAESAKCRPLAEAVARRNNRQYAEMVQRLLGAAGEAKARKPPDAGETITGSIDLQYELGTATRPREAALATLAHCLGGCRHYQSDLGCTRDGCGCQRYAKWLKRLTQDGCELAESAEQRTTR